VRVSHDFKSTKNTASVLSYLHIAWKSGLNKFKRGSLSSNASIEQAVNRKTHETDDPLVQE
jgi:hypothetical protein